MAIKRSGWYECLGGLASEPQHAWKAGILPACSFRFARCSIRPLRLPSGGLLDLVLTFSTS